MNRRAYTLAAVWLLSLCACSSTSELSREERAKADPAIMKLLSGANINEKDYDVGFRPDGVKEYGVIILANKLEELKSRGIKIQSVFGDVLTARLTLPELREILSLSSVRAVGVGSKNYPQ
jgi:hypothetical protein